MTNLGNEPWNQAVRDNVLSTPPKVTYWAKVYMVAMALLYLLVIGIGLFLLLVDQSVFDASDSEMLELRIQGAISLVMGIVLSIAYVVGLIMPQAKAGWIFTLVLICFGMTSCCTWPATIPLLIFWIKPETRTYFNMNN